jgi:hypothetical protein
MLAVRSLLRLPTLLLAAAGLVAMSMLPTAALAGDVPMPVIPKAVKGKHCVMPTEDMRKNHMKYILRHRDLVVHDGIRTQKFNLRQCLACHVPREPKGKEIHVSSKKHFCEACHAYAGVKIDCFQCHSDQPPPENETHFHTLSGRPLAHPGHSTLDARLSSTELQAMSHEGGVK